MKKKVLSLVFAVMCMCLFGTVSANAMTRDAAVNWAKAQIGTTYDFDGNGYQCSDFGTAYINYLITGNAYSGTYTTYMGYNYFNLSYPSGWQRIENTADFVPEPGDILCFAGNSSNSAGHVAVAIEGCTVSVMYGVGQNGIANGGNGEAVKTETLQYYGGWGNFQGVIRPKWDDTFFDFWGVDDNLSITGTYKFWWKEIGYGNCDVNLYLDNTCIGTIYPDTSGYFSYSLDTTKYSNGTHTLVAKITSTSGATKSVSRTFNSQNNQDPIGYLDLASGENGVIRLIGWAVDEDTPSEPLTIHVYVGGPAGSGASCYNIGKANIQRVGLGWGDYHGYNTRVKVKERGQQTVYVYAINSVLGNNPLIGSGTVNISNPYSVTYKAENSTVQISNQEKYSSFDLVLSTQTPTRTGYTFKNWNTLADGSGKSYAPGATYSDNANLTLYAQWESIKIHTQSTVSKADKTYTVKTNIYNTTSCELIVSGYKNGRLVDLKTTPYSKNPSTVLTGDIDEIKVMLWKNFKDMKPLSDAEVIPVT